MEAKIAWQCLECNRVHDSFDAECPLECNAELVQVVVFDGEICDHPITNGFGQCAACGVNLDDLY